MGHKFGQSVTPVIICADDFGLSPSVSDAILELIHLKRISATSCMVVFPEHNAFEDLQRQQGIDVGLHFTMTDFTPLSKEAYGYFKGQFPGPKGLFGQTLRRNIPATVIKSELEKQYSTLRELIGRHPDFIDAHHHIHQYPCIAEVLSKFCSELVQKGVRFYVRSTGDSPYFVVRRGAYVVKSGLLSLLARRLRKHLNQYSIPYNNTFSGAYKFSDSLNIGTFSMMLKITTSMG